MIPEWAVAGIVAELDELQVEFRADPFCTVHEKRSHKTVRRILIGWRRSKHNSFKELRQAASSFSSTRHLGPGQDVYRIRIFDDPDTPGSYWVDDDGASAFSTEEEAACRFMAAQALGQVSFKIGYIVDQETVEHRGKRAYLKAGGEHDNGWRVDSIPVAQLRDMMGVEIAHGVDRITEKGSRTVQNGQAEQAGGEGTPQENGICSDCFGSVTYCS